MSKVKWVVAIIVCGICLWSVHPSWAKDYTVTINNNLATGGVCSPVTLSIHSSGPVKTYTLQHELKGQQSDTFNATAVDCNRMQVDVQCQWCMHNPPLPGCTFRKTSASSNFDCVSGTVSIAIESGQLRVKAP